MRGFSLVELSIVLVILGLLTGGILTGQTLIRAAELRSVTTEFQRYQSAVNTFRDKYFALPGDMRNAESFWGTASNGTCPTATDVGTATCNGNGDGSIGGGSNEMYRWWQHLANAGLIEGSYEGTQGAGGANDHELGVNSPRSKLSNAGWGSRSLNTGDFVGVIFLYEYGNSMLFGGDTTSLPMGDVLTNEEAWNIDTKLDDGKPGLGGVKAFDHTDCSQAANTSDYSADYNLTDSANRCALIFNNAF